MKKTKYLLRLSLFILSFASCKKNNTSIYPVPEITNISPDTAAFNATVTITGTGFNSIAADNTVKFNNAVAVVKNVSATQIVAVVPKGSGSGPVIVTTGNKTSNGVGFTYQYTYTVSTLSGTSTAGFADGNISTALFNGPYDLTTDTQGNIYIADYANVRIRKITATGIVSTLAGSGTEGFADGNGAAAQFNSPAAVAIDAQGNIYVADDMNNRIRKITLSGIVSTFAGNNKAGFVDGSDTAAQFNDPVGLATDEQGNIYVSDFLNNSIRKITSGGVVSTLAGTAAQLNGPVGLTTDPQGNIYVADILNNVIRKITSSGVVSIFAGNGQQGYLDGNASSAEFDLPNGVASDAQGNIYVSDGGNHCIREITTTGVVSTIAGSSTSSGLADGIGAAAQFYSLTGIAIDIHGNIYISDGNRIRMITVQ